MAQDQQVGILVWSPLAGGELRLNPEEFKTLDAVSRLPSEYPAWMLARQSAERSPAES